MKTFFLSAILLTAACSTPRPVPFPTPFSDEMPAVDARQATSPLAHDEPSVWLGAEVRGYPAGVIPAFYGETPLSDHAVLTFDLAANVTDREDNGEHDDEDGDGFGGGVGYRYYYGERFDCWFFGVRIDLWSLSIDWEDDSPSASGNTDVLVLQPTVEGGYGWWVGERWRLNVFAAAGAEINVDTDGEDVGEGAIGILGVSCVYGF